MQFVSIRCGRVYISATCFSVETMHASRRMANIYCGHLRNSILLRTRGKPTERKHAKTFFLILHAVSCMPGTSTLYIHIRVCMLLNMTTSK